MAADSVEASKQADLRKKIEYQVACEERAHRIVERLIDNPVSQEHLIDCLHYITTSHYADIVEERAVTKLCGYPLCPSPLGSVPKQKYIISTKTNKVYDIEARKNFCGPKCFKASKHLMTQISDDPVWTRKNMPPRKYNLLSLDMKSGKLGDEVVVSKAKEIKLELDHLEKQESYFQELTEKYLEQEEGIMRVEHSQTVRNGLARKGEDKLTSVQHHCVYTLDKAMNELGIADGTVERKESDKGDVTKTDPHKCNKNIDTQTAVVSDNSKLEEANTVTTRGKGSKSKSKSKEIVQTTGDKTKTDYLMHLLDKRKNLLSKMVDIQNEPQVKTSKEQSREISNTDEVIKNVKSSKEDGLNSSNKLVQPISNVVHVEIETDLDKKSEGEIKIKATEQFVNQGHVKHGSDPGCKLVIENKESQNRQEATVKTLDKQCGKETKSVSTVELICKQVQTWFTKKTVEYLKADVEDAETDGKKHHLKGFEKKWEELEAKVDAHEREFDTMLGEEQLDDEWENRPTAPAPHYEVLRQEVEENQFRIQQFMKGSFTYKVEEKIVPGKSEDTSSVVLPSVDRYDQLVIRQKIVLERISKVLSDVLFPLHLLVQDVFTELRELICTFNLTSENILFRPAEWTVVTLVLLRMLSRKVTTVQKGFMEPGAEKYFHVLLSSFGASLDRIDDIIGASL